jgi:hypothetical protein
VLCNACGVRYKHDGEAGLARTGRPPGRAAAARAAGAAVDAVLASLPQIGGGAGGLDVPMQMVPPPAVPVRVRPPMRPAAAGVAAAAAAAGAGLYDGYGDDEEEEDAPGGGGGFVFDAAVAASAREAAREASREAVAAREAARAAARAARAEREARAQRAAAATAAAATTAAASLDRSTWDRAAYAASQGAPNLLVNPKNIPRCCYTPGCALSRRYRIADDVASAENPGFGHNCAVCPSDRGGCGARKPRERGGWPRAVWTYELRCERCKGGAPAAEARADAASGGGGVTCVCDACGRAFHARCAGLVSPPQPGAPWLCPDRQECHLPRGPPGSGAVLAGGLTAAAFAAAAGAAAVAVRPAHAAAAAAAAAPAAPALLQPRGAGASMSYFNFGEGAPPSRQRGPPSSSSDALPSFRLGGAAGAPSAPPSAHGAAPPQLMQPPPPPTLTHLPHHHASTASPAMLAAFALGGQPGTLGCDCHHCALPKLRKRCLRLLAAEGSVGAEIALAGALAIGARVEVFWPRDGAFYSASIIGFDAAQRYHTLTYDVDGQTEARRVWTDVLRWPSPGGAHTVAADAPPLRGGDTPPGWADVRAALREGRGGAAGGSAGVRAEAPVRRGPRPSINLNAVTGGGGGGGASTEDQFYRAPAAAPKRARAAYEGGGGGDEWASFGAFETVGDAMQTGGAAPAMAAAMPAAAMQAPAAPTPLYTYASSAPLPRLPPRAPPAATRTAPLTSDEHSELLTARDAILMGTNSASEVALPIHGDYWRLLKRFLSRGISRDELEKSVAARALLRDASRAPHAAFLALALTSPPHKAAASALVAEMAPAPAVGGAGAGGGGWMAAVEEAAQAGPPAAAADAEMDEVQAASAAADAAAEKRRRAVAAAAEAEAEEEAFLAAAAARRAAAQRAAAAAEEEQAAAAAALQRAAAAQAARVAAAAAQAAAAADAEGFAAAALADAPQPAAADAAAAMDEDAPAAAGL